MAKITLQGSAGLTVGVLPEVAATASEFTLTGSDLSAVSLDQFEGKKKLISIEVVYQKPVPEIGREPDCAATLAALRAI